MTEGFIFRTATPDDYGGTCALLGAVDELHRVSVPWLFQKPVVEPRSRELFEALLTGDDSTVLVAESGSTLVGVATVIVRDAPPSAMFVTQRWGVLDNIAVLDSWRRRGVGTSLTREAERWAKNRGANWLELGVYEFNDDARAFYQALGYLPVSTKLRKPFDDAG